MPSNYKEDPDPDVRSLFYLLFCHLVLGKINEEGEGTAQDTGKVSMVEALKILLVANVRELKNARMHKSTYDGPNRLGGVDMQSMQQEIKERFDARVTQIVGGERTHGDLKKLELYCGRLEYLVKYNPWDRS